MITVLKAKGVVVRRQIRDMFFGVLDADDGFRRVLAVFPQTLDLFLKFTILLPQ